MLDLKKLLTKVLQYIKNTTVGTFTKSQSGSTSNISVRQYGNVVMVSGYISGLTFTANSETTIGSLSGVSAPPDNIRTMCMVGSNAYSVGTTSYIGISTSKSVYITTSNGGSSKVAYFDICYVANS